MAFSYRRAGTTAITGVGAGSRAAACLTPRPWLALPPSRLRALRACTSPVPADAGPAGQAPGSHDMLLLTTTGRHSGRPHTSPPVPAVKGELAVIASYGGIPRTRLVRNLLAEPHAEVQAAGKTFPVVARTAGPAERPACGRWPWPIPRSRLPGEDRPHNPVVLLRRV